MAPTGLRERFLRLINRERRRAEAGQPAEIMAKMNSLIDDEIIEALYAASREGVIIRLNVRGICALRPGVPGHSDTIEVVSVVDRFLEHSRIYWFLNGGEEEIYLASADWMTRNFDKRIELMFPVETPGAQSQGDPRAAGDVPRQRQGAPAQSRRNVQPSGSCCRRGDLRVQQSLQDEVKRIASLAREVAGVSFESAQPRQVSASGRKSGS